MVDEDRAYLSVITLGELSNGINRLTKQPTPRPSRRLADHELPNRFGNRILPVNAAVADKGVSRLARMEATGTPINGTDALIAATAVAHRLEAVTRNVAHFQPVGVDILCPWQN